MSIVPKFPLPNIPQPVFGHLTTLKVLCALTPANSLRMYSNKKKPRNPRKDCAKVKYPECRPEDLAKSECAKRNKKEKAAGLSRITPLQFQSMWYNPECCVDVPCPDMEPRFDVLHYKPTDKAKRKYMQTWSECPKLKMAMKHICCPEQVGISEPEKRKRKGKSKIPKTACSDHDAQLMSLEKKCPRIQAAGCAKRPRIPPTCKTWPSPSKCKKVCCPFPCFSECSRRRLKKGRPKECNCLRTPSMCEVWELWRLLESSRKCK